MYVVIMHKHSFTQYQYLSKSIVYNDSTNIYTITDTANQTHTFSKNDYLIAIMG